MRNRRINLEKVGPWVSLGANVSVVLGIVFLAIEIGQNTSMIETQVHQARAQLAMREAQSIYASDQVPALLAKVRADEDLSAEERVRWGALFRAFNRNWDNQLRQFNAGLLESNIPRSLRQAVIQEIAMTREGRSEWGRTSDIYTDDYRGFVDEVLATWDQEERTPTAAFVDVQIVPMDSERVLRAQTVVVVGDRIVTIGPVGDVEIPLGSQRIEGNGRYLMPGLVDMHTHVDDDRDLTLFLANGVTTVRNMHGGPEHLERRERVAREEVLGAMIFTAGPIIDGPVDRWPGNAAPPLAPEEYEVIESNAEGARLVKEQHAAGYDFIKVYDNLTAEAYSGVVQTAHELGLPVAGHVPFGVGLAGALESGLASIEHLRGYVYELLDEDTQFSLGWDKRSRFLAWQHVHEARFQSLAQATVAAGVWNVPTLTRYQKNMMPTAEHRRRYTSWEARYLDPDVVERVLRQRFAEKPRYGAFSEEDFERGRSVFEAKKAFTRALNDAGAKVLLGSDDWFGGFATHQELRNLVDAGLSSYEAIAAGTSLAATFLGAEAEFGKVAVGLRADLLLVEGNPLVDVENAQVLAGVMVRGRWLDGAQLDRLLEGLVSH